MKTFWIAFALGAAVGTVAALLYAPQSGVSTRKKLKRGIEEMGDTLSDAAEYLKEQADRLAKEAQKLVESSKSSLDDGLDTATEYARTAATKAQAQAGASRMM